MREKNIIYFGSIILFLLTLGLSACDQNASQKTLGNSKDTTSVFKAGGPPIRDTATVSKDRRDSLSGTSAKPTSAKGNADPTGHNNN